MLNSHEESPKLYNMYFVAGTCLCILFSPEQWNHCSELTLVYLPYFVIYAHSTNTQSSSFDKEGLSFYAIIFKHMWMTNKRNKKDTIEILCQVNFENTIAFFFLFSFLLYLLIYLCVYLFIYWLWKQVLVLTENMAPGGYQVSHSAAKEHAQCPRAEYCWTPTHYGFTGILFSWIIPNAVAMCVWDIKEW